MVTLAALDTVEVAVLPIERTGGGLALVHFVIAEGEDPKVTAEHRTATCR